MGERFRVEVEKDQLVFAAGHFITYDGDRCERLHGHNYRLSVMVEGPLDENGYVIDFLFLRDAAARIAASLDHRMLLPTQSRLIAVAVGERSVDVRFADKEWRFPREDCILAPVENTTTELLARWIGQRLLEEFDAAGVARPGRIAVRLDENFGQWATWESAESDRLS